LRRFAGTCGPSSNSTGENKTRDREQAKTVLKSIRDLMRQYLDSDAAGETEDDDQVHGADSAPTSAGVRGAKERRSQ
jgi:hypothetical protein